MYGCFASQLITPQPLYNCICILVNNEIRYEQGICGLIVYTLVCKRKRRKANVRKYWTKQWLLKPFYPHKLARWMENLSQWLSQLSANEWRYLFGIAAHYLSFDWKKWYSIVMRAAVTPHERLTVTLRFLATVRLLYRPKIFKFLMLINVYLTTDFQGPLG